jgi:hypothetical protein
MLDVSFDPTITVYEPTKEFMSLNTKDKILMDFDLFKQITLTKKTQPVNLNLVDGDEIQVDNENYFGISTNIEPILKNKLAD